MPLLPPGARPVRVLHLSDLHLTPGQRRKQEWVSGLSTLRPDLVIDTGDNLAHAASVPVVRDSLGPLLDAPGVFVFGSNDYFSPTLRNPLRYLLPDDGRRNTSSARLPWSDLRDVFTASGWVDLTNRRETVKVGELSFAFAGVDDPHLRYDRLADVADRPTPAPTSGSGVAHAPYLRVLDQFAADGYDAILAGHTHGGQVCLPGVGALTTNCDLEPARAKGLHRHPADVAGRRPGLRLAARLGRDRHLAVRPDQGGLPPRGHPAHAGPTVPLNRLGNAPAAPVCSGPCEPRSRAGCGAAW